MAIRFIGVFFAVVGSFALAVDYTFYLPWQRFHAIHAVEDHFEVSDRFENRFELRVEDEPSRRMAISNSMVFDLLGLPNASVYPTFALQFQNGILWLQESVPPKAQWMPATLQPKIPYGPIPTHLNAPKAGQWVSGAVVGYVLGFNVPLETMTYSRTGHFVPVPGRRPFEYAANSSLSTYLSPVHYSAWTNARGEQDRFLDRLNYTLSRLEKITPAQWATLYGWAWAGEGGAEKKREFYRRLRTVRGDLSSYLAGSLNAIFFSTARLASPIAVPPPHLLIPPRKSRNPVSQVDRLWSGYFSGEALPPETFLELRQQALLDDSRICEVGEHMEPRVRTETLPQVTLNPLNRSTLVVVALNDTEAREILRTAEYAYAHTLGLDGNEYPHGTRLTEDLVRLILARAKRVGAKRIIVSELPGPPEVEALLKKNGLEILVVDHHDYEGDRRFNSRASLEQVAEILGAKLSPVSRAIAIADSQFVYGKLDLGVPVEMVVSRSGNVQPPRDTLEYRMQEGKLIFLRHHIDHAAEFEAQEVARAYPRHVNVLTTSQRGLHFSGEARLVARLIALAEPQLGQGEHFFSGGTRTRGGYVRMQISPALRDSIVEGFLAHLAKEEGLDLSLAHSSPSNCHLVSAAAGESSPSS